MIGLFTAMKHPLRKRKPPMLREIMWANETAGVIDSFGISAMCLASDASYKFTVPHRVFSRHAPSQCIVAHRVCHVMGPGCESQRPKIVAVETAAAASSTTASRGHRDITIFRLAAFPSLPATEP